MKPLKRLTALLVVLVLLVSPVYAASTTSGSYFDFTDDILEDGSLIYYFQELSLQLPASWRGSVMALQDERGTSFYQKASYEKYKAEGMDKGGFLFSLGASVNQSFTQLPSFRYLGFSEDSCMNYYLQLPTDYPAYNEPDIREEYDQMIGEIDYVVDHVKFYPAAGGSSGDGKAAGGADSSSAGTDSGDKNSGGSWQSPSETSGSTWPDAAEAEKNNGLSGRDDVTYEEKIPAESEEASAEWTPQEVRYAFEHNMLPQYLYDRPYDLLLGIYKQGLYPLWEMVSSGNGVSPTYKEEDYKVHWYTAAGDTEFVQLELPAPDANTLCYRIYLVYGPGDSSEEDKIIYYTVESDDFMPNTAFLCTWSKDREHSIRGTLDVLDPGDSDFEDALKKEAEEVAKLAGIEGSLKPDTNAYGGSAAGNGDDAKKETASGTGSSSDDKSTSSSDKDSIAAPPANLQEIACPQQGFTTMADKSYEWDYQVGTGISVYTEKKESIPYVIIYQGEDLIGEPFELIKEQYTPHIKDQYGDDLISFEEKESYEIGGKTLPAGIYTYKLGDYTIEMVRLFDSTGSRTVSYTAKYVKGKGDATLKALDDAVRYFREDLDKE